MSLRILYLGFRSGTSGYRSNAMKRLGHEVRIIDPTDFVPSLPGLATWCFWTGFAGVATIIQREVLKQIADDRYDVAWVDSGEYFSANLIRALHKNAARVVNYNHDDPFGRRDWTRFRHYRAAAKEYDLVAVVRTCNIEEAKQAGARKVLYVVRSADEVAHAARRLTADDVIRWSSEVTFVGTCMEERGAFMRTLVERGVPLSIYGRRWQRAKEWEVIRKAWRGPNLSGEEEYVRAVQCAKICLGLLSKENRDLITTRSLEIPAIGSLFLAERTSEHEMLYRDNEEAVFWTDAEDCADKCHALLADEKRIRKIAAAGHARALANGHFNENAISAILKEL